MIARHVAAALVAAACVSAAFDFSSGGGEIEGVLHASGEKLQRQVIEDDGAWLLVILDRDETCGKPCADMKKTISKVTSQAKGIFNVALVYAHDTILGHEGEMIEVYKEFNQSTIPGLMIYGPGPKRIDTGMKVDSNTAASFLGQGPKFFYNALKMFQPTFVTAPLRGGNLEAFLTRPAPLLPRVILVSDRKETAPTIKKLSTDFASRAVFGQLHAEEAGGKVAKALGIDPKAPGVKLPVLLTSVPDVAATGKFEASAFKTLEPGALATPASLWRVYTGNTSYEALRLHLHTTLPLAPLPQLRTPDDYTRLCGGATDVTLCFIGILPHDAEAASLARAGKTGDPEDAFTPALPFEVVDDDEEEGDDDEDAAAARRRKHSGGRTLDALARVAARSFVRPDWGTITSGDFKGERLPVSVMWVDADQQPDFAAAFKVTTTPAFIGVNPRKRKFAAMRASFGPRNIHDFMVAMMEVAMPARPKTGNAEADAAQAAAVARAVELVKLDTVEAIPPLRKQAPPAAAGKKKTQKGGKASGGGGGKAKQQQQQQKEEL